jgi:putative membrane protein
VGIALFFVPTIRVLFYKSVAFSIVLSTVAILSYHNTWNLKTISAFLFIIISGIAIEIIGTSTGVIFGSYQYLESLGTKILDVPILIGINWLILTYCSNAIASRYTSIKLNIIIGGALLMVAYDVMLEFAAPIMRMWVFESPFPPLKNFIAWFVMAVGYQTLIVGLKINTENKVARYLFFIQITFLSIISFTLMF